MLELNGRVYQLLANPVRVDRVVSGAVILVLDVTEKQKAEVMRREFSANVSHELKTPLMSISGYAEIIENNMVKPEDIPKFAGRIHSEASRLSSLVEDIIKLSRLDENDQSIPMEEVDLMQICRDVEGHLSIRAKEQQVKMTLRGESCRIKGARQVLYEMIYNLCDNAIKYNRKDGEVEVTVSRGRNGRAVLVVFQPVINDFSRRSARDFHSVLSLCSMIFKAAFNRSGRCSADCSSCCKFSCVHFCIFSIATQPH